MPATLYALPASPPCKAVAKALELRGIPYKTVGLLPPLHVPLMLALFGGRTVPAVRFADGARVQNSRAILRAIDHRGSGPALYPNDDVKEAERWGDKTLQPLARRLAWVAFTRHPRALYDFQDPPRLPKLPPKVILAAAPAVNAIERRLNGAGDETARADLQALPGHLIRIDAWIADGRIGGDEPNAGDLQIASSLALLHAIGDVRPLIADRPAETLTFRWMDRFAGEVPMGVLPPEWLPTSPPAG